MVENSNVNRESENFNLNNNYIQKRTLRMTASFIGFACFFFGLLKLSARDIIIYILNVFGVNVYLINDQICASQSVSLIVSFLSFITMALLPTILLYLALGAPFKIRDVIKAADPTVTVLSVPICLFISIFVSIFINIISMVFRTVGVSPNTPDFSAPTDSKMFVFYLLYMTILPAIFEELFFRGVIMTSLRRFGDWFAIIVSALLFGLLHGNMVQFLNAFFLGILLGYFAVRSGSIVTSMVIHFFNNLVYSMLGLVLQNVNSDKAALVTIIYYAVIFVLGIVATTIYLVKVKNPFNLNRCSILLTQKEKLFNCFITIGMIVAILFFVYNISLNFTVIK